MESLGEERQEPGKTLIEVLDECCAGLPPPCWALSRGDIDQYEICGKAYRDGCPGKTVE